MLESYLDFTLPFAAVDQSPTKRICDRRAASAVTSQTVYPKTTSKDHPLAHGHPYPLNPKIGFLAMIDETATIAQESSAPVSGNKKSCTTGSTTEERNGITKLREDDFARASSG